jgi:hypothetical protein
MSKNIILVTVCHRHTLLEIILIVLHCKVIELCLCPGRIPIIWGLYMLLGICATLKWQTQPLVSEGAPHGQDSNFHLKSNIWLWAPAGARHHDRQTHWPSVATWLWLWLLLPWERQAAQKWTGLGVSFCVSHVQIVYGPLQATVIEVAWKNTWNYKISLTGAAVVRFRHFRVQGKFRLQRR